MKPTPNFYIEAAVLDGVPGDPGDPVGTQVILDDDDGVLLAAEAQYLLRERQPGAQRTKRIHAGRVAEVPPYDGKLALGVWHYTAKYAEFDLNNLGDPKESRGNNGVYAFAEHVLYQQAGSDAGLRGFLRVGAADPRFNRVAYYVGNGVVYRGPIKGRESDEIGLAVAAARNGSDFRDAQERTGVGVDDWEVAIELTYRTQLLPWLALQPDIQYIINPGTDPSVDNALVLATRFQISF